jgi:hypothetical protein
MYTRGSVNGESSPLLQPNSLDMCTERSVDRGIDSKRVEEESIVRKDDQEGCERYPQFTSPFHEVSFVQLIEPVCILPYDH